MSRLTALILLIILSPLMIVVALIIFISDGRPIIYKSIRIGKNEEQFVMYKFRSMVKNADEIKKDLLEQNEREYPLFKIKDDIRITKFGKFIRKTSIDELPQLINIIKGDMNFIGVRPILPEEIEAFDKIRFKYKPGITGLAQVNGRSLLSIEDQNNYDTYYSTNRNFLLNLKILFKTIIVVVSTKGAS